MGETIVLDDFGSRLYEGAGPWSVLDARGPVFGPTHHRQRLANDVGSHGCVCYVEHHLNAVSVKPGAKHPSQYVFAITNLNATRAVTWGADYSNRVAIALDIKNAGVHTTGPGLGNIARVKCPALLVEPGFISDPVYRARISTGEGLDALASCLVQSIKHAFPGGGIVGLSVGHKYRGGGDMGANAAGAEDPAWDQEAEIAEAILTLVREELLRAA